MERRPDIETGLRRALERNDFFLHFQPQRSLDNGRIIGAEALVRWSRPGIGMIPTREFLPFTEESGPIVPMGAWILKTACEQAVAWSLSKEGCDEIQGFFLSPPLSADAFAGRFGRSSVCK